MASKPTLVYFPLNGRAFAARAALRYAKFPVEDKRVPFKVFGQEYKQDPKKAPLGSLPVLEFPAEGLSVVQSTAITRWAAKKSDLYPSDDLAQLIVDEALETANEILGKAGYDKDEAVKKAKREEYLKSILPMYMRFFIERINRSGGPFLLGSKLCVADLFLFAQLELIYSGNLDYVPADTIEKQYPAIHSLVQKVKEHPIARAELEGKL